MTVKDIIKLLVENKGWYLVRLRGSHRQFKLRNHKKRVTINCKMEKVIHESTVDHILKHCFDTDSIVVKNNYKITIEKSPNCYSIRCDDLPGCVAVGDTIKETKELMMDSVRLHLEGLKQDGIICPDPSEASALFKLEEEDTVTTKDLSPEWLLCENQVF